MGSTIAHSDFEDTVETQLTFGTASLLGIFFGLVMVCGLFFGFGYSLGRRNNSGSALAATNAAAPRVAVQAAPLLVQPAVDPVVQPAVQTQASTELVASLTPAAPPLSQQTLTIAPVEKTLPLKKTVVLPALTAAKPALKTAAISPAPLPSPSAVAAPITLAATSLATAAEESHPRIPKPSAFQPVVEVANASLPAGHVTLPPQFTAQGQPSPYFVWTPPFDVPRKSHVHRVAAARTSQPAMTRAAISVQIAALSREDDAEVLASALRERGFAPSIKNGGTDTLYHVEVGPFNRELASATRQRLLAKGYNAILK